MAVSSLDWNVAFRYISIVIEIYYLFIKSERPYREWNSDVAKSSRSEPDTDSWGAAEGRCLCVQDGRNFRDEAQSYVPSFEGTGWYGLPSGAAFSGFSGKIGFDILELLADWRGEDYCCDGGIRTTVVGQWPARGVLLKEITITGRIPFYPWIPLFYQGSTAKQVIFYRRHGCIPSSCDIVFK